MRKFDIEEVESLNAEQWQLDLLSRNPSYVSWGPHEDYMATDGGGWDSRIIKGPWADFKDWGLDDLNECVNFYFSVGRDAMTCPTCGGNGYHPDAQEVANTFYAHMNPKGEHWNDKITQDEVLALLDSGRLCDFTRGKPEGYVPTASEVNAANAAGGLRGFMGHGGINRHILIKARCNRLGLQVECPACSGSGSVYTAPAAHVSLTLWMLHPRKGCSRGVEVSLIEQTDLPEVFAWLREAADRNAKRFAGVFG